MAECAQEWQSIDAERHIAAQDVAARLQQLFQIQGTPAFTHSGNSPHFIAVVVKEWLRESGVKPLPIEPGNLREHAYGLRPLGSQSLNSWFGDEPLNREVFSNLKEAKALVEEYRLSYNNDRLRSSLGYQTAAEFVPERQLGSLALGVPRLRSNHPVVKSGLSQHLAPREGAPHLAPSTSESALELWLRSGDRSSCPRFLSQGHDL